MLNHQQIPAFVPTLTCVAGTNADLFPQVLSLYIAEGARIADVTYGRGVFWKNVDTSRYDLVPSDIATGIDLRRLPYADADFDALVLDPPYMHGGKTVKASINACYHNETHEQGRSHERMLAFYLEGVLEAMRVLKRNGILLIKCQDEIESGKQRLMHAELLTVLPLIGFRIEDIFVLHASSTPAMREQYQLHARKNHSYLLVARLTR